jgi:hypothetical protein
VRRLFLYVVLVLAACAPTVIAARAVVADHTGAIPVDVR